MHGHQLSSAFLKCGQLQSDPGVKMTEWYLVSAGNTAEYGAPRLARLVPGGDGLPGQGADRGVLLVEVEDTRGCLLEELAATVACTMGQ